MSTAPVLDAFLRRVAIRNKIFVPSLLADYAADGSLTLVPLAPQVDADGEPIEPPTRYERPSRIAVTGSSQTLARWTY